MKGVRYMFKKLFRARDPWYGPDSPSEGMLFPLTVALCVVVIIGLLAQGYRKMDSDEYGTPWSRY